MLIDDHKVVGKDCDTIKRQAAEGASNGRESFNFVLTDHLGDGDIEPSGRIDTRLSANNRMMGRT
jgi:hypothetical protein